MGFSDFSSNMPSTQEESTHFHPDLTDYNETVSESVDNITVSTDLTTFHLNLWYQYAQFAATSKGTKACYVCTRMPVSTATPYVVPGPINLTDSILHLSMQSTSQTQWYNYTFSSHNQTVLQITGSYAPL